MVEIIRLIETNILSFFFVFENIKSCKLLSHQDTTTNTPHKYFPTQNKVALAIVQLSPLLPEKFNFN
jgi:hypothetical protein